MHACHIMKMNYSLFFFFLKKHIHDSPRQNNVLTKEKINK